METQRALNYGRSALILDTELQDPHAAAIFDFSLTNGLAAIVAGQWPDELYEKKNPARVKSARCLLHVVQKKASEEGSGVEETHPGVFIIWDRDEEGEAWHPPQTTGPGIFDLGDDEATRVYQPLGTVVDVNTLLDALDRVQPVRHASSDGGHLLTREDIHALIELDHHRSLGQINEERREAHWHRDQTEDRNAQARAVRYVNLIGEDEAARRAQAASEHPDAMDPDDRGVEECPACGYEALRITSIDEFGLGFGAGSCLVCAYVRSQGIADDEARDHLISRQMAKD